MQPQDPQQIYPAPTSGVLATPQIFVNSANQSELEAVKQPYSKLSIIFLIFLVLTFFTPLGSVIFLPLLIVGGIAAVRSINHSQDKEIAQTGQRNPIVSVIRFFLMVGGVIVLLIVGIIAFFFIGVSTGLIHFRMGS